MFHPKRLPALTRSLACACALCGVIALTGCAPQSDQPTTLDLKQGRSAAASNTQTLQAAVNAASYSGGGTIYLPAGTYYFDWGHQDDAGNCAIIMRDNVTIVGAGMDETFLKPLGIYEETGEAEHGIDMFAYDGVRSDTYLVNADFSDFTIDGSATQGSPTGYNALGKGFFFTLFKDCDWNRVKVMYTDGTGFGADFPVNCTMTDCIAVQCGKNTDAEGTGASGFGVGTGYSEDESMTIENCSSTDNMKYGFFFEHQTVFDNPHAKAQSAQGFVVRNCSASGNLYNFGCNRGNDVRFIDCTSDVSSDASRESYTRSAFQFHNYSARISVEGGSISQTYADIDPDDACYEAVRWALARNIAEVGSDGYNTFRPDDKTTRGEFAVFLWRYAGRPGNVVLGSRASLVNPTSDVQFDSYYGEAVRWLKEDDLSIADPFRPEDPMTYREIVTVLWRYRHLLENPQSEAANAASSASGTPAKRENAVETATRATRSDSEAAVAWAVENGILPMDESSPKLDESCPREALIQMLRTFDDLSD